MFSRGGQDKQSKQSMISIAKQIRVFLTIMDWNMFDPNSYIKAPHPSTSECDCVSRQSL